MRLPVSPLLCLTACQPAGPDADTGLEARVERLQEEGCSIPRPEAIAIPGGSFVMGAPEDEIATPAGDETQHEVTLTHAFSIGIHEVSQAELWGCLGFDPSKFVACGARCPADSVTWHEAALFTAALSVGRDLPPCYRCDIEAGEVRCASLGSPYQCQGYRLPTEAEWEYAARSGTETAFSMGRGLAEGKEYECSQDWAVAGGKNLGLFGWYCANSGGRTHVIGRLTPAHNGLYDTMGNVWEWCHDGYAPYPDDATDPLGPDEGDRVMRGGAFDEPPVRLRSAARYRAEPERREANVGLRVARSR